jgi:hypothetical protein
MDGTTGVVLGRGSIAMAGLSPGLTKHPCQRIREAHSLGGNTLKSVKPTAYLHQVPEVVHEVVPPFSHTSYSTLLFPILSFLTFW